MEKFNLSLDEANQLLASYRAEIENQRKNLDAIVSLAFLLEKHIDELKSNYIDELKCNFNETSESV